MVIVFSPRDVNRAAKRIGINGCLYSLTRNNCHKWAKLLINEVCPGWHLELPLVEGLLPPIVCDIIDICSDVVNWFGASKVEGPGEGYRIASAAHSVDLAAKCALVGTLSKAVSK